jgi:aminopeptidase
MESEEAAKNALICVLEAKEGENLTIICDDTRKEVGEAFKKAASKLNLKSTLLILNTSPQVFREKIPSEILSHLEKKPTDIYINLLRGPREETPFRIKLIQRETANHKTRLGHCPGITLDMLTDGALALSFEEHSQMQEFAQNLIQKLKNVVKLEISTRKGTKLSLEITNRPFFTDTMMNSEVLKWMNLPTGEVIVAPIEKSLEGKLVCDLAIGGIGLISNEINIIVKQGVVEAVTGSDSTVLRKVQNSLHIDAMAKIVGEFAFGINPKARFVNEFLETEKMLGTIHIAFGNNSDMPEGKNNSANHMDFMMSKPTVSGITREGLVVKLLVDGIFQSAKCEVGLDKKDELPISKFCRVIDYVDIFKTDEWWEAIVLFEIYSKRQVGMYLWQKKDEKWKRKNKFGIRNPDEWNKLRAAVDQFARKL